MHAKAGAVGGGSRRHVGFAPAARPGGARSAPARRRPRAPPSRPCVRSQACARPVRTPLRAWTCSGERADVPPAASRRSPRGARRRRPRHQRAGCRRGRRQRADLAVGGKPGNALAASDVEYLDSVGTFVGESTERNRQLRAVRAERQPVHGGRQAKRRSKQLAPADVPDPHRAPHLRRGEQIALAEGERVDGSRVDRPRAPGSAKERAELLSRLDVPNPDAATLSRHRQPTSIG